MARSTRLSVCMAIETRNSSNIHCMRSISRQRTTPWIAEIGPFSINLASADRCVSFNIGCWPGALPLMSSVGALRIKAFNPISNNLRSDAAGLRRLGPARPIIDTRKREKTPCLGSVPRMLRQTPKRPRVEISAQWNCQRHGEPPSFATLNQTKADLEIQHESRIEGGGITCRLRWNSPGHNKWRDEMSREGCCSFVVHRPSWPIALPACAADA